nr:unnamed protein product [Spirometra erinaceieuropaei]
MDGTEGGDRRLLAATAELEKAPQSEYLIRTPTSSTEYGLARPRSRFTHSLESPEQDNNEDLRSNVAYAAYKDA